MKIAHPSCSPDVIEEITNDLELEAETVYAALEKLELKQSFLAATTIFQILKNEFPTQEYTFIIDYVYNNDAAKCEFQYIKINDGVRDIKDNRCARLSLNAGYFMENIEDTLMTPNSQNIKFFNDEAGINDVLTKIMGHDYHLWQHMYLEQQLPEKSINQKKPKI